jgi:hypothetical protein
VIGPTETGDPCRRKRRIDIAVGDFETAAAVGEEADIGEPPEINDAGAGHTAPPLTPLPSTEYGSGS